MGSAAIQGQVYARLAWFLAGAYPGASKRKRIARDFNVSPETAKGWLCGYAWPRHDTFLQMRAKWGPEFIRFVYMEMDELDARVSRLERELRIEEARGAALVSLEAAGTAPRAVPSDSGVGRQDAAQAAAIADAAKGRP
jgi:hypothetical protein